MGGNMKLSDITVGAEYGALDSPKGRGRYDDPRQVKVLEIVVEEEKVWNRYGGKQETRKVKRLKVEVLNGPLKKASTSWYADKIKAAARGDKLVIEARQCVALWKELAPGIKARIDREAKRTARKEELEAVFTKSGFKCDYDGVRVIVNDNSEEVEFQFRGSAIKKLLALLAATLVIVLALAGTATAASHNATLDAVASQVAGHPVMAVCADTNTEWVGWQQTLGGQELDGFTFIATGPNIYLAPFVCRTLAADLGYGPSVVGDYWMALALKTLLHEAVHQRGVYDEGVTDCTALTLLRQYAVSSFGYTETVTKQVIRSKRVKGNRVYYLKTITVPNPALDRLQAFAHGFHLGMPPEYQGGC